MVFQKRDELKAMLESSGVSFDAETIDSTLMIAQYNELFSLPWNRDNEVWLEINDMPEL